MLAISKGHFLALLFCLKLELLHAQPDRLAADVNLNQAVVALEGREGLQLLRLGQLQLPLQARTEGDFGYFSVGELNRETFTGPILYGP